MSDSNLEAQGAGLALLAEQQHWSGVDRAVHTLQVTVEGELDPAALEAALHDLALRQPVLASAIGTVPGYHGLRQFPGVGPSQLALSVQPPTPAEPHWQLTLSVPRRLADAGSLGLLFAQLLQAYVNGPTGADEALAQFEQYLQWRAEVVLDEDAGSAAQYWQAHVGHAALPQPSLPYRRKGEPGAVAQVGIALPGDVRAGLQALAVSRGVSVEVILQAAWWLLLARLSGRSTFIAAWRHDGRGDYAFFEQAVGVFEKSLPLHITVDLSVPFEQCLAPLAGVLEQHRTWQEYWSVEGRSAAPSYGFAVRRVLAGAQAKGAWWSPHLAATLAPGLELALEVGVDAEGAAQRLSLAFASGRYSGQAMQGLLAQYQVLLRAIVAAPSTAAGELPLLGEAERARLLAFNPPSTALDPRLTLAQRIGEWAAVTPDAPALVGAGQTLSYAELEHRVQHVAAALASRGVVAGHRVALALPRSAHWLVAALATWRLGAAWLPLDPQWPRARLALLVQQAGATLLVGQGVQALDIAQLDIDAVGFVGEAALADVAQVTANDLAYVLFTSGSTGTPKAVAVEHGALFNYVASASAALGLGQCRRFAFGSSVVADLGHTSVFGALYHGAALHLADEATMQDGQAFAAFIEGQGIDCLKIVPSHLAALLEGPASALPGTLVLGGEAVAPALVERLLRLRPDVRLFNHYGPSETTVGVLVHAISAADLDASAVPLTEVLANNHVLVLDAQRQLVATGELGELYIAGAQLARGYLNAPQQQAEAFVEHPLLPGVRLYRSGDLARHRPEGGIVLQGRADQQVKLRGFRVELAEIEAALAALEGVREAAVVLDGQGEPLAFVTALGEPPQGWAAALKAQLAERLPAVMVPRQVQGLARMPRLGNGKLDRQALASLEVSAAQHAYVAPRDALEQLLAERMAQLLGSERLSVEQDFFAAGGHSLLVIKLVAGMRKLLQCEVQPGVVFDNPSPAALARALRLQESAPGQLERLAQARLRLEAMTPEEKARLMERARQLQGE